MAGIIYGALVALAQSDIKRLIAYSSVSHLGFCMLGVFALNRAGRAGRRAADGQPRAVDRRAVRRGGHDLRALPHAADRRLRRPGPARLPVLAFFMLVLTLSSIGLPGLNGFVGEFLMLLGMFQRGWADAPRRSGPSQYRVIAVLAVSGVVLGAWYMLWMVQRVFFGPLRERKHAEPIADLSLREVSGLGAACA